jgi:hypothetical protein
MARRKGLVDPVKASKAPIPAGAFRVKRGTPSGSVERRQLQRVRTAVVTHHERFHLQPVKHAQSSGGN